MTSIQRVAQAALMTILVPWLGGAAHAVCAINAAGLAITPGTASTGIYTSPIPPTPQAINITITGTYVSVLGGTCTVAISFHRASVPASMAITGGGSAILPYTVQSAPGGGNTLLYTGALPPGPANLLSFSFNAGALGLTIPFTINLTAYALAQPGVLQAGGTYSDSLTLDIFNETLSGVVTKLRGSHLR